MKIFVKFIKFAFQQKTAWKIYAVFLLLNFVYFIDY